MKQLGKPRRNLCAYLLLRKSDERRFSQAGGRISQCLAAERRLKGCEAGWSAPSKRLSINLVKYEKIHVLPTAKKIG